MLRVVNGLLVFVLERLNAFALEHLPEWATEQADMDDSLRRAHAAEGASAELRLREEPLHFRFPDSPGTHSLKTPSLQFERGGKWLPRAAHRT